MNFRLALDISKMRLHIINIVLNIVIFFKESPKLQGAVRGPTAQSESMGSTT